MQIIEHQQFDAERALYGSSGLHCGTAVLTAPEMGRECPEGEPEYCGGSGAF